MHEELFVIPHALQRGRLLFSKALQSFERFPVRE